MRVDREIVYRCRILENAKTCKFLCFRVSTGAATVYSGLENSWKILYKSLQYATVQTVDHK